MINSCATIQTHVLIERTHRDILQSCLDAQGVSALVAIAYRTCIRPLRSTNVDAFEEFSLPTLSDREVMDVMESALTLLGTATGTSLRGDSVLQAARKKLAALILQLNGAAGSDVYDQLEIVEQDPDPSTLQ